MISYCFNEQCGGMIFTSGCRIVGPIYFFEVEVADYQDVTGITLYDFIHQGVQFDIVEGFETIWAPVGAADRNLSVVLVF